MKGGKNTIFGKGLKKKSDIGVEKALVGLCKDVGNINISNKVDQGTCIGENSLILEKAESEEEVN